MKKLALVALALFTIVACKNTTKTDNQSVTKEDNLVKETSKKPIIGISCYEYNDNGNHIKMEITKVSPKVIGNLNIAYAEKDSNYGIFVGNLKGNKLIGVYTFNAEGVESSREIAFIIKDDQLIEGYGELDEDGTKFKDINNIKYSSKMPLTKIECSK